MPLNMDLPHTCTLSARMASLAALLSLAACGGGGDGGGANPAVSLKNVVLPTLTDETYENGDPTSKTLQSFQLTADLEGDVAGLSGKTVYVVVEDPDGFVQSASIQQPLGATRNTLLVDTKVFGPRKGRYSSGFRFKVCHDSACTAQFGGSPITVPYDITVLQGFVLNGNAPIAFSARAGESKSVSFPLTVPDGLLYHPVSLPPPMGGQPQLEISRMSVPSATSWRVATATSQGTITGSLPAGVASEFLWARATVQTPKGKLFGLSAQVQVVYTLTP